MPSDSSTSTCSSSKTSSSLKSLAVEACTVRGIFFVLENPAGSLLFAYKPIATALERCRARTVHVRLGSFGADTPKPLCLVGTAPWLEQLRDEGIARGGCHSCPSASKRRKLTTVQGDKVTGIHEALQASAIYLVAFCRTVARLHFEYRAA